jgi:putative oxidoreductase
MRKTLLKFAPVAYALLRIVAGLMFAMHGSQKLLGVPGGKPMPIASLMGVAGIVELVGGLLIAVGLLTTYAAFIASGQMAVAYFLQHAPQAPLPILNQGELAVLYCFLFLYIAAQGPGILSIDSSVRRR